MRGQHLWMRREDLLIRKPWNTEQGRLRMKWRRVYWAEMRRRELLGRKKEVDREKKRSIRKSLKELLKLLRLMNHKVKLYLSQLNLVQSRTPSCSSNPKSTAQSSTPPTRPPTPNKPLKKAHPRSLPLKPKRNPKLDQPPNTLPSPSSISTQSMR